MTETTATRKANWAKRISWTVAIVLTAVIAYVGYHQTQLLPRRVSRYVNEHYLRGTNFEFSVDDVSGFLVRHVTFKNPTLRYHSADASYNVFRADELSIDYDLMPIFAFRLVVTDLKLRNVAIHLRQDAEGKLVLPVLPRGRTGKLDVSPVVNVRRFTIDGLEMKFGGNKKQLAVRDVHMNGAFDYENHLSHLMIDNGGAYLIDSKKTVSQIRLDAKGDASTLDLNDFAVRLDESFVVARGGFRDGRVHDTEVIFNPISLPELHQLGVAPDKEGRFSGRAHIDGPVDSLQVEGQISGEGLGVELSSVSFKGGLLTPQRFKVANLSGAVFGSKVNGAFSVELKSEDFVYDGQIYDLDLGRGFITDTKLDPMSLTGHVWVKKTKAIDRVDWVGELSRGVYDGFEAFNVRAKGSTVKKTGTVIERAHLERPGFSAEGTGSVSADDMCDVLFKVNATDLTYFWKHFKLPVVGGVTNLNGRLRGPIDDFTVNLNGPFQNLHFEPCLVDSGSVAAEARHIGTLAPEVTVAVEGRKGSISGQWFERPIVHLEIDTSRVQIRNARFARGDTSFVADLDVKGKGERATIDVRHITVTTKTDVWATKAPSQMHVEPGALYVDSLVLACPRGELGGEGVLRDKSKTLEFDAWGKGIDLSVVRDVTKLPFRLEGKGNFKLGLSGKMDDPRGRIEITIDNGVVDSVAFDNLTARAGFDGNGYTVEHLQVTAGRDTATANGTWMSNVSPVRIGHGERTSALWSAPLEGRLRFAHYPLATVFKAAHRPTVAAAAFNGTVDLGGTLDSPTARVRGQIVPAPGPGREIPPADVDVSYADGFIRVARFNTTEELNLQLSGSFPMTLSMHHGASIEENEPLQFKLDIQPRQDAPVEIGRYIKGVSLLRGIITGNIEGAGTPASPRLSGGLAMTKGELRVVGLDEQFRDIALRVDFIDDLVRLTTLSTRSGKKGSLVASGWARISNYQPSDYKLDLTMREFELSSIEDIEVVTDGTLSARLKPWRDGRKIPNITGRLNVREASITMDIMKTTEGAQSAATAPEFTRPTDRPNWLASVDLNADKNVWIRNPDLIAELEGNVVLNRDERGLYFRGDMSILRGSYKVFGNKFEISDGTFDFSASETLRPSMQINAFTRAGLVQKAGYTQSLAQSDNESGSIVLALSWPYDQKEPRIHLSTDPPMGYSESDLWNMLGRGTVSGAGLTTNALERAINAQIAGDINVNVGQRAYNNTDPGGKAEQVTTVGVSKYLWQDIYLEYQRDLSTQSQQEVNVEYRLGKRFRIRSQLIYNSRRQTGSQAQKGTDEYNLDLKYRFEF